MTGPVTALGDVVTLKTGPFGSALHKTDYVVGGIPLINPTHIQEGRLVPEDGVAVGKEKFAELRDFALDVGDVVMGRRGEMGRCAVVTHAERGWLCGTGSIIVRPRAGVDSEFLQRFLASPATVLALERDSVGTTMVNLNQKILLSLEVALPSLGEQRRIAAILDKADALRAKRRQAIAKLDELLQSVFFDMFGSPDDMQRWGRAPLGEVASTSSGGTPDRSVAEYYGGDIPWVKSGEVVAGEVATTEESITPLGLANSSAKLVPAGTVLLAMYGATAGAVAVLRVDAATNQAVCAIKTGELLHPLFLMRFLKAIGPSLVAKAVGGAQPNLSQALIRTVMVPIPPLELQSQFADVVSSVSLLRLRLVEAAKSTESLFSSLQGRAFVKGL